MKIILYIFSAPLHSNSISREENIRMAVRRFTHDRQDLSASSLTLGRTEKGRPYLIRNGKNAEEDSSIPDISITDSGSYWIVGVSDQRIGIDLQENRIRKAPCSPDDASRCRKLASRYFHDSESSYVLSSQTDAETIRRFFQIWTAKEAYVKYTGTGIDGTFSSFAVNTGAPSDGRVPDDGFSYRNPELGCSFIYPRTHGAHTLCVCVHQEERICEPVLPSECHLHYLERIPSL